MKKTIKELIEEARAKLDEAEALMIQTSSEDDEDEEWEESDEYDWDESWEDSGC